MAFYSIPEFNEWKKQENFNTWHVKYYKGLLLEYSNIYCRSEYNTAPGLCSNPYTFYYFKWLF